MGWLSGVGSGLMGEGALPLSGLSSAQAGDSAAFGHAWICPGAHLQGLCLA